jgi:CheY-like chemotaxis protein
LSRLPAGNGQDRGTILVVDDQEEMRAVAVKALGRQGYRILQAGDGNEALSLFRQFPQQIRLILMDLTMPCMDGLEACRELRQCGVAVPVILTSGFSEAEALRRFDDLDLAGFLQKPFELGALVERVRKTLTETAH